MPQPIAYNTGSQTSGSIKLFGIEYAISSSIVSGSNNQRWFSSVNPGNGVVFVTSNYTQSFGTYQSSVPLFFTASDYTAAAITGAINGLPDRFGQVPFTTTSSAYAWVQNSGKYFMMNYEYPQIVTDKLILNLNSQFLASYPTTQSTWYNLNGGLNAGVSGSPVWDANKGFTFVNGDTSKYAIINPFPMPTTTVSFEIVLKTSIGNTGMISYATVGSDNDALLFNPSNIAIWAPGGALDSGVSISDGLWKHMIRTSNRTTGEEKLYINGVLRFTGTLGAGSNFTTNGSLVIAQEQDAVGGGFDSAQAFGGNISLTRIYNKILSLQEVQQNYYGGPIITDGLVFAVDAGNLVSYERGSTTTYSLTGSLSGSLVNGVGFSEGYGRSWMFDGTNDKIQVNNFPQIFDGSLTMECWIWWNDDTRSIMFGNYNAGANDVNFEKLDSRRLRMYWNRGERDIFTSTNFVDLNTWQHIVIQRDVTNNVFRFYVNGQLKQSTSNVGSGIPSTGTTFRIGADSRDGATVTNGNIAIMKLYNRALSADEVSQNFNAQSSRFGF